MAWCSRSAELFNQDGAKVLYAEGYAMFGRHPAPADAMAEPTVDGFQATHHPLLAIVNPLAIVPFSSTTRRALTARSASAPSAPQSFQRVCGHCHQRTAGLKILEFFSISLASFQVGGGMLLLMSSLNMLNAQPAEAKPSTHEMEQGAEKAAMGASIAVVPLTIPLLTGPATMSTVVIYAEKSKTSFQLATLVGYGVVIGLATALLCARPADRPGAGQDRHQRHDRLMGLILAALAVEVMADGLVKLFPRWRANLRPFNRRSPHPACARRY